MTEVKQALAKLEGAVLAETAQKSWKAYSAWASKYDDDLESLGLIANQTTAEHSIKFMKNDESSLLLDVAAGTGLMGVEMCKAGYKGSLDAVDINAAMLKEAKSKEVYRKVIVYGIKPDEDFPVDGEKYDAVISSGGFYPNHLEEGCIYPMMRCLKPGGLIIFNSRKNEVNRPYLENLAAILERLIKEGKLSEVVNQEIPHYQLKPEDNGVQKKMRLFIYKKL